MRSQRELVQSLVQRGVVRHPRVIEVLQETDRKHYSPRDVYVDAPQGIGSNATISAPHMHGWCLELLAQKLLQPGARVLDVGCGSGYLTACFARMVGLNGGKVVGVDHIPALVQLARDNITRDDPRLLQSGAIQLVVADGRQGFVAEAPYDVIHVGATAAEFPQPLADQLKPDGCLVVPEGAHHEGSNQELVMYTKGSHDNKLTRKVLFGVRYVPLCDSKSQIGFLDV